MKLISSSFNHIIDNCRNPIIKKYWFTLYLWVLLLFVIMSLRVFVRVSVEGVRGDMHEDVYGEVRGGVLGGVCGSIEASSYFAKIESVALLAIFAEMMAKMMPLVGGGGRCWWRGRRMESAVGADAAVLRGLWWFWNLQMYTTG